MKNEISRNQGQTLKTLGIELYNPCSTQTQFYVICSKVSDLKNFMNFNQFKKNIYIDHSPLIRHPHKIPYFFAMKKKTCRGTNESLKYLYFNSHCHKICFVRERRLPNAICAWASKKFILLISLNSFFSTSLTNYAKMYF